MSLIGPNKAFAAGTVTPASPSSRVDESTDVCVHRAKYVRTAYAHSAGTQAGSQPAERSPNKGVALAGTTSSAGRVEEMFPIARCRRRPARAWARDKLPGETASFPNARVYHTHSLALTA
ncbi:hypothetical protein MTO96_018094 [Rhipicephalus appendiculatus]